MNIPFKNKDELIKFTKQLRDLTNLYEEHLKDEIEDPEVVVYKMMTTLLETTKLTAFALQFIFDRLED